MLNLFGIKEDLITASVTLSTDFSLMLIQRHIKTN